MKYLPIGVQNFEKIIRDDLLYVDKTRQVYDLIRKGSLYFLSRPRRFGKTLLVSILANIFKGKKELFKDLYIGKETDYKFETFPVLQFNFSDFGYKVENLPKALSKQLKAFAKQYCINKIDWEDRIAEQFKELVSNIVEKTGKPVAILIDEYDKPITDFINDIDKAELNRDVLKDFFSQLKPFEEQGMMHFLFITGVSKFTKVSLFSDLNNLTDLSMETYGSNDLLGITEKELKPYFKEHIKDMTKQLNISKTELLEKIKYWYNGYSYDGKTFLYNPYSLINFFFKKSFGNYWFTTATPTFLVEKARDQGINPKDLENLEVDEYFFQKFDLRKLDMLSLLFQTGYITIKKIEEDEDGYGKSYYLAYPNYEVRHSLIKNLVESFTYQSSSIVASALRKMQKGLKNGQPEVFVEHLKTILADISFHWQPPRQYHKQEEVFNMWEGYFHAIIYLITSYMEMSVQAELTRSKGRLDLIAQTKNFVYLMEFKLDEPAENAIAQIKERDYAAAYKQQDKKVFLIGIGFSKERRNVETCEVEEWK